MRHLFQSPRSAVGAVAGGKRLARARRRVAGTVTAARAPAPVAYRLGHEIVEVAEVRCVAGEICDEN